MTRSLWLIGSLVLPALGCSVGTAKLLPSDVALNQCDDSNPCAIGSCRGKVCGGSMGELTSLLVSVTPPAGQPGIANRTYFKSYPADGTTALVTGGGKLNLKLESALELSNTVSIDATDPCPPTFAGGDMVGDIHPALTTNAIPADVTFTPSLHALGIPTDTYTTTLKADHYLFEGTLPPGEYDVYIKPHYSVVGPCPFPPRLLLNQSVASSPDFKLPPPSALKIDVTWPIEPTDPESALPDPLAGWTLDLVDPNSGLVLSTVQNLKGLVQPPLADALPSTSVTYEATLSYAPIYATDKGVLVPQSIGNELIRLKPPLTKVDSAQMEVPYTAPIFYAQLDGALVDPQGTSNTARIVQQALLPAPVMVTFQTALGDTPEAVPAGVTVTATELDGVEGISTQFARTVQVDRTGLASVELMPGRYRVNALAKGGCTADSCLSAAVVEWIVRADTLNQSGKVIQFWPASQLVGRAFVPSGDPAVGATVRAVASTAAFESNVLNLGDGSAPILPRASGGIVDKQGQFSFDADPGTFDFSVAPDPSTGFGWLVHPRLVVPDDSARLDSIVLDLPIVYSGAVTFETPGSSTPIPSALIRAYVYLKPDGTLTAKPVVGGVAVQVAETQADDAGVFVLLIPPRLDPN